MRPKNFNQQYGRKRKMQQDYLKNLHNKLTSNLSEDSVTSIINLGERLELSLPIFRGQIKISVKLRNEKLVVLAKSMNEEGNKWLNQVLLPYATLEIMASGVGYFVIVDKPIGEGGVNDVVAAVNLVNSLRYEDERLSFNPQSDVTMYWASGVYNFGDWSGPTIVQKLTGRRPVPVVRTSSGNRILFTVGSIINRLYTNDTDIWGSGLIAPITQDVQKRLSQLSVINVYAVRGYKTKEELESKLDWDIPNVFGDPALLLPRIFEGKPQIPGKVSIIPHVTHQGYFINYSDAGVNFINARGSVSSVVDEISSSQVVLSSSLHGIIVAEAYGVPWVWINVIDKPLWGHSFKFEDFFSTLKREMVSEHNAAAEDLSNLDWDKLASKATLPPLKADLGLLLNSLPVNAPTAPWTTPMFPHALV